MKQLESPLVNLGGDVRMPALGLGVYRSSAEETPRVVQEAIETGYRLVDTASAYMNEEGVGEGIRRSGIEREAMFVTSKLWLSDWGYDRARHAVERSLRKSGLEYFDLYLLHWPVPAAFDATVESYRALQDLRAEGRLRAIGVSNFSAAHLEALMARTDGVPAVNQVEMHPHFAQSELRDVHDRLGIVTQAWSPIGGVNRYFEQRAADAADPFEDLVIQRIAEEHGKTPAQVILRWHVEHGVTTIPKTTKAERLRENLDVFDFTLSREEVSAIDALDRKLRGGPDPEKVDAEAFDFVIPE